MAGELYHKVVFYCLGVNARKESVDVLPPVRLCLSVIKRYTFVGRIMPDPFIHS